MTSTDQGPTRSEGGRSNFYAEILLISFAALLLEISYTRIASFKLFYYYTYLVIGLALLGIGTGGVFVVVSKRLQRATTEGVLLWCALVGAVSVLVGYILIAVISLDTLEIWQYGSWDSVLNILSLVAIALCLFASFAAIGIAIATLFARRTKDIGRLYFADLLGAGLACAIVVSLLGWIGPPATIMLAGLVLAAVGIRIALNYHRRLAPVAIGLAVLLAVFVAAPGILPDQTLEQAKADLSGESTIYSSWSPLFRVDVVQATPDVRVLVHDGLLGSVILRSKGDPSTRTEFETDLRRLPFSLRSEPPEKELIIGAAGGHEILASLYFDAGHIDAVELNPVTYELVTDTYADYNGQLAENPRVNYVKDEGRSYLARKDNKYDLIWYPAPDSYSANAAAAGAFVLSESYLYTSEAIQESLEHLSENGTLVVQFGEIDFQRKPNRTTRFVATARHALAEMGIDNPEQHILASNTPTELSSSLSTMVIKRAPFTDAEVEGFVDGVARVPKSEVNYAPGVDYEANPVSDAVTTPDDELDAWFDSYPYDVRPITDDAPFFWHFARFGDVVSNFDEPIDEIDLEVAVGERVLILLLLIAIVLAAVFLLLPFVAIRETWRTLPKKRLSALYFASLGLGFLFFEITLIQRLTLFLGYPTYSLTVTLMSILIFTGIGALLSTRYEHVRDRAARIIFGVLALLTLFYLFALPVITEELLGIPLAARIAISFLVLAPLGLCLGAFMPLGLSAVSQITDHPREYVAWGWAVNGFASVIGAVLTTILAMTFGFNVVLVIALATYGIAILTLRTLRVQQPGS